MKIKKIVQDKKEPSGMPFWLQIVLILLFGVLASIGVYIVGRNRNTTTYTVTFAYDDGTIIDQKQVKAGKGVEPPEYVSDMVFRGWNSPINNVQQDMEVHPMFYTISDDVNLFYFNSVYVREGKDCLLDLNLTGEVNLSSAELVLSYDTNVLQFKSENSADICTVKEKEHGTLAITINSDEPVTEKTLISQLKFHAKKADAKWTEIGLKSKGAKIEVNGMEYDIESSTINNKIYFLQEVG